MDNEDKILEIVKNIDSTIQMVSTNKATSFDITDSKLESFSEVIVAKLMNATKGIEESDDITISNLSDETTEILSKDEIDYAFAISDHIATQMKMTNPYIGDYPFTTTESERLGKIGTAMITTMWKQMRSSWQFSNGNRDEKTNLILLSIATYIARNMIINQFVGVQPMTGPVSKIHAMILNRDTAVDDDVAKDGEKLILQIVSKAVEARTRRVSGKVDAESIQDMNMLHDSDIATMQYIGEVIGEEILVELYKEMKTMMLGCGVVSTSNAKENLYLPIHKAAINIADNGKRGCANRLIASNAVIASLMKDDNSGFVVEDNVSLRRQYAAYVGMLGETIQVYCDHTLDNSEAILLYKGSNETDAGLFYCPYVVAISSGVVMNSETFCPEMTFMTRYGWCANSEDGDVLDPDGRYISKLIFPQVEYTSADDSMLVELFETNPIPSPNPTQISTDSVVGKDEIDVVSIDEVPFD